MFFCDEVNVKCDCHCHNNLFWTTSKRGKYMGLSISTARTKTNKTSKYDVELS